MNLILASTSTYRAALLARLRLPFLQIDPNLAEIRGLGESPAALCLRLAQEKALAVARTGPSAPFLIIGSDQVVSVAGAVLGKPGNLVAARAQLHASAGKWVTFETAVSLVADNGYCDTRSEVCEVRFRNRNEARINAYLDIEQPWDCAGSIKAEGLGISLIEDTRGRDINTVLGLPLMLLVDMFAEAGFDLLNNIT